MEVLQLIFDVQQQILNINDEIQLILHHQNYQGKERITAAFKPYTEEAEQEIKTESFNRVDIDQIAKLDEIGDFLQDLQCPICLNIIEDPMSCIRCELNYCNSCIEEWSKKTQNVCPTCRNDQQVLMLNGKSHLKKKVQLSLKEYQKKLKLNATKQVAQIQLSIVKDKIIFRLANISKLNVLIKVVKIIY